jgi:protoporphyrinogen/coproporphyrinogen III oxidase
MAPVERESISNMDEHRDVVVVGAGIAGLTAAWDLRDLDVLVLESGERVGGRIRSERRGDYWLNFGAHVFGGSGSQIERLLAETGVAAVTVPGRLTALALRGRLLTSGRVASYPLRLPLSITERLSLAEAGARLRRGVAAYDRAARRRPGEKEAERRARTLGFMNDRTFADFLGRVAPIVDQLLRVTVARSSAEPEELSAGHGIGYFHLVWRKGEGLSRNILGGSSTLTDALAAGLAGRVLTSARATSIDQAADGVRVAYELAGQRHRVRAEHVVVATPAYVTHEIVRGLPSQLDAALRAIPYGPYVVVSFLTDERDRRPWDDTYAIGTPGTAFNMVFNTANVVRDAGPRRRGGSLMVYSGGPRLARPLLELSDDAIVSRYLADLDGVLPGLRPIVSEAAVQRWEHAIPYPAPGRAALQPALETPLGRIHLAGDYLGTWYTETAVQTAAAAAARIRSSLIDLSRP